MFHRAAVHHILRYLQGTINQALLMFSTHHLALHGFFGFDWAGDANDYQSTTWLSFFFFLGSSHISWKSKTQEAVSSSSTELQYWALVHTTVEIICPTLLYTDSDSAWKLAFNDVFHEQTKHVEVGCHFICQYFHNGTIQLFYIPSNDQVVDFFTESHSDPRFFMLVSNLSMLTLMGSNNPIIVNPCHNIHGDGD